jgi:hypothetical protein
MSDNAEPNALLKAFVDVLKHTFALYKLGRMDEIDFIGDLSKRDTLFWDYRRIPDLELNAAVSFCDSFFDAARHGSGDVDGIPIDEAEGLVIHIIDALSRGERLREERILSYYCGRERKCDQ